MAETEPSKLYLVVEAGETAADRLTAALAVATPASLLIAPPDGKSLDAQGVLPLIELAQSRDVAVMLADDPQLVRTTKADGCHLTWSKNIAARATEAREILGHRYMLGVDVGRSRHDAMELGETGADYIAFGIPPHVEEREAARERRAAMIEWWSTIFEIPCVAFDVETTEDAADLASRGADFVAFRLPNGGTADDIRQQVLEVDHVLRLAETPA
ncbi:MAG: thiamine phosphate synthase [Hyphomicrobiaceae bacterium]|nr:thiamine phosphate synthase [Hyphomicrobiaceae bacterium]